MSAKSETRQGTTNPISSESGDACRPGEVRGLGAVLGWAVPIAMIVLGSILEEWILWLWIPAFLAIGITCSVNAARCGRTHCYAVGPICLVASLLLSLIAAGALPERWIGEIGNGVLIGVVLAYGVEWVSGRRYIRS
ncbi:MAG: hypothetical protein ACREK5_03370 [Gemmatimonadota bacterium]